MVIGYAWRLFEVVLSVHALCSFNVSLQNIRRTVHADHTNSPVQACVPERVFSSSTEWTIAQINMTAKSGCSSQLVMDPADNTGLRIRWRKVRWVISLAGVLLADALDNPCVGLLTVASKRDGPGEPGNVTTSDELTPSPYARAQASIYIRRDFLLFLSSFLHHPFFTVHFHSVLLPFKQQLRCPFILSTSSIFTARLRCCYSCLFIKFTFTVHIHTFY